MATRGGKNIPKTSDHPRSDPTKTTWNVIPLHLVKEKTIPNSTGMDPSKQSLVSIPDMGRVKELHGPLKIQERQVSRVEVLQAFKIEALKC